MCAVCSDALKCEASQKHHLEAARQSSAQAKGADYSCPLSTVHLSVGQAMVLLPIKQELVEWMITAFICC